MEEPFFFLFLRSKQERERKPKTEKTPFFFFLFLFFSFLTDAEANRHATPSGIRATPTASRNAAACARVGRPSQRRSSCCEKRESVFLFFRFLERGRESCERDRSRSSLGRGRERNIGTHSAARACPFEKEEEEDGAAAAAVEGREA